MKEECRNIEEAMQLYIDCRIPDSEKIAFENHIDSCTACRTEWEAFSILHAGLESMPLDEPDADFNAAVLGRIPFPARETVPEAGDWFSMKWFVTLSCVLMVFSSLGIYLMVTDSGKISHAVESGFQRAIGTMEWLGMDSLRGSIDLMKLIYELPILSTLLNLGKIFLNVASTTFTDPTFAVFMSGILVVGVLSTLIMAKLMKPALNGVSSNGTDFTHIANLF